MTGKLVWLAWFGIDKLFRNSTTYSSLNENNLLVQAVDKCPSSLAPSLVASLPTNQPTSQPLTTVANQPTNQAIIWTSAEIMLITPLGTNASAISIKIQSYSFKKMYLEISLAKRRPFCLDHLSKALSSQLPIHLSINPTIHQINVCPVYSVCWYVCLSVLLSIWVCAKISPNHLIPHSYAWLLPG